MAPHRTVKVYRLRLEPVQGNLFYASDAADRIVAALAPGNRTERYRREWIVGSTTRDKDLLSGRIGVRGAEGTAEVWNEQSKDFEEVFVPASLTVPFAISLANLSMAVQPRPKISLNALVGAFRNLLIADGEEWFVRKSTRQVSFQEWRRSVDKVTSARFRLRRPNPHYRGTPDLEALMEQAEAEVATLELTSATGVDTDAPFVQQSQAHVEQNYGKARYVGERGSGTSEPRETVFDSTLGAEEEAVEVPVDASTGEADLEFLAQTLAVEADPVQTEDSETVTEAELFT